MHSTPFRIPAGPMPFVSRESRRLHELARKAFDRCKGEWGDREFDKCDGNATVAVVFAALTVEAFVNELGAGQWDPFGEKDEKSRNLAAFFEQVGKESIALKVQLAAYILGGHCFNTGELPFQDFDLLVKLRNAIVHSRPSESLAITDDGRLRFDPHTVLAKFAGKNVLAEAENILNDPLVSGSSIYLWIGKIDTRAMGKWACDAAANLIRALISLRPGKHVEGHLKIFPLVD